MPTTPTIPPASINRSPIQSVRHKAWFAKNENLNLLQERFERFLILSVIVTFLLENQYEEVVVNDFAISKIAFLLTTVYAIVFRFRELLVALSKPVSLLVFGFVIVGILIENKHPYEDFFDLYRIAQMMCGALVFAVLQRNKAALNATYFAIIATGTLLATALMTYSYDEISTAEARDYQEASVIRGTADIFSLGLNMNAMASYLALAFSMTLTCVILAKRKSIALLLLPLAVIEMIAAFIPMSRSGMILISALIINVLARTLFAKQGRRILSALFVVCALIIAFSFVPSSALNRFSFSTEFDGYLYEDARTMVYALSVKSIQENFMWGVGIGNFHTQWGLQNGFERNGYTIGAHNCYMQVWIAWGVFAFILLVGISIALIKNFKETSAGSFHDIMLSNMLFFIFSHLMTTHTFYGKEFAIGIGLLLGAACFVSPRHNHALKAS